MKPERLFPMQTLQEKKEDLVQHQLRAKTSSCLFSSDLRERKRACSWLLFERDSDIIWYRHKIKNADIGENADVVPIDDKRREAGLRWFRHIQRRNPTAPVRRSERLALEGTRRSRKYEY
uniref:Uncharacterized protein LOC104222921 n=1 Tax=Nicotiana sylvestris TaxID=4096 RepID=A0A1U7W5S0_NICSY|nr:PREDICTED: uncharacterized protein LOC104222921 [Nicotiana sylvestris]